MAGPPSSETLNKSQNGQSKPPPGNHTRTRFAPGLNPGQPRIDGRLGSFKRCDVSGHLRFGQGRAAQFGRHRHEHKASYRNSQSTRISSQSALAARAANSGIHLGGLSGPDGGDVHRAAAQRGLAVRGRANLRKGRKKSAEKHASSSSCRASLGQIFGSRVRADPAGDETQARRRLAAAGLIDPRPRPAGRILHGVKAVRFAGDRHRSSR